MDASGQRRNVRIEKICLKYTHTFVIRNIIVVGVEYGYVGLINKKERLIDALENLGGRS